MRKNRIERGIGLTTLGAAVIAGAFVALGVQPDGIAGYYRDTLTPAGFVVWFSGFIAATLAPPVIAIGCWYGSTRLRHGWLLHFLLFPTTYTVVRGSIAIMLLAANEPDRDSLTGWATDPATLMMLISPVVYFLALGLTKLHRRRVPANDR